MLILRQIETEKQLAKYNGEDQVISSQEMEIYLKETYKEKRKLNLQSGLASLDDRIQSFEGGELTVISGPTGSGKTLLAQTITAYFAHNEQHSLWFTYEVPAYQFLKQFGELCPKFYMPKTLIGNTLAWINARVTECKLKNGLDAVFVDHLHYLVDMGTRLNMSLEIGKVMRYLKQMAIKHNVAVFVMAHLEKIKAEVEPDINNLRDSSFVGQEADNVLLVWRKKTDTQKAVLKVCKNRRLGIMNYKCHLVKKGYLLGVDTDAN